MCALLACMSEHSTHSRCLEKAEGSFGFSLTPVTDGCELPGGYWELKQEPLEEQPMFFTAELFTAPLTMNRLKCKIAI